MIVRAFAGTGFRLMVLVDIAALAETEPHSGSSAGYPVSRQKAAAGRPASTRTGAAAVADRRGPALRLRCGRYRGQRPRRWPRFAPRSRSPDSIGATAPARSRPGGSHQRRACPAGIPGPCIAARLRAGRSSRSGRISCSGKRRARRSAPPTGGPTRTPGARATTPSVN